MVSAYYNQADVKADLGLTGTGLNARLDAWSDDVEGTINDLIHDAVSKRRIVAQLPDVPLIGTDITASITDAANHGVKTRYYEVEQRDLDRQKFHEGEMVKLVNRYVANLKVDTQIYGRIIR